MNIIDLRNQIDNLAWGPRGNNNLRLATTQASPAMSIKIAFEDMRARDDLDDTEIKILRGCCQQIRLNQWFGLAEEAANIEAGLPHAPVASVLIGVNADV